MAEQKAPSECVWFLSIMNKAAVNIHMQVLWTYIFLLFWVFGYNALSDDFFFLG